MLQWLTSILFPASQDELVQLSGKKGEQRSSDQDSHSAGVNLVAIGCLIIFVSLGIAQAISIRLSVGGNGLGYDASAAVTAAEGIKFVFSVAWLVCFNRDSIPMPTAIPASWASESSILFLVAVGFAIQNQVAFLAIERLGASLFAILGNLKIVFTCIFMRLILGKRFTALQWMAVYMLTISAAILKLPFLLSGGSQGGMEEDSHNLAIGFALMVFSTSSSGLCAVVNEMVLKRDTAGAEMPFMLKNAVLYAFGFGINYLVWLSTGVFPLFAWMRANGVFAVVCMTGMGLSCSVVLKYLDNIYRCFAACAQVLLTVLIARLILPPSLAEEPFGVYHAGSLLLLAQAICVYQNHESPRLGWHVVVATIGTFFVCILCYQIDKSRAVSAVVASLLRVGSVHVG
jgi:UDP-sugar transporter A1/2/3